MKADNRNNLKSFLEIGGELLPSKFCRRAGWDGVWRSRSQNVFLGPSGSRSDVSDGVPADCSKAGLSLWQVVCPTLPSSGIRCKHLISGSCVLPFYFIFCQMFQHRMLQHAAFPCAWTPHTCCCSSLAPGQLQLPVLAADGCCCRTGLPARALILS